jgi:hypothetical protein
MKKQTAVKWLHYHLLHLMQTKEWRSKDLHIEKFDELFIEALTMEKEQLIEALLDGYRSHPYMAEQYYKETYGGDE